MKHPHLHLHAHERLVCPVCRVRALQYRPYDTWPPTTDLDSVSPPYRDTFGYPSYESCVRCGYAFGFTDDPGADVEPLTFAEYYEWWQSQGEPWPDDDDRERFLAHGGSPDPE
jgi:hypothetical protein